jgi:microcin C transport system permease protein
LSQVRPRTGTDAVARSALPGLPASPSPMRRVWRRFKAQRLGYWSLVLFVAAFAASLAGPLWSNDKPLVVRYDGHYYFPIVKTYAETTFGGDFPTPADYLDPYVKHRLTLPGNFAVYPPNHYYYDTLNYFSREPTPRRLRMKIGSVPMRKGATCSRACCTAFAYRSNSRWC